MTGGQRFSGQTVRRFDEHPDHSRRALFQQDRIIRRLGGQVDSLLSTLEYIAAVADGEVGGQDPPWQVEAIGDALSPWIRDAIAHRHDHRVNPCPTCGQPLEGEDRDVIVAPG